MGKEKSNQEVLYVQGNNEDTSLLQLWQQIRTGASVQENRPLDSHGRVAEIEG